MFIDLTSAWRLPSATLQITDPNQGIERRWLKESKTSTKPLGPEISDSSGPPLAEPTMTIDLLDLPVY